MRLFYHPSYNISFFGIENLHPFDSKKYGRAWAALKNEFGPALASRAIAVDRPVTDQELLAIHAPEYLEQLNRPKTLAQALEVPPVALLPALITHWRVLRPMRWAVRGSILATQAALDAGLAVNLSGGYHHAKPARGEGFCLFSDIALMVSHLRSNEKLGEDERVVYIDLDAHQGNGVCHCFLNDPRVVIFDMFNGDIYPCSDEVAQERIDHPYPLKSGTKGGDYLEILRKELPALLNSLAGQKVGLAIYNAGTDPFIGDQLGGLSLSAADILERDLFTVAELRRRMIPTVMLPSGGYSRQSWHLAFTTIAALLRQP